MSISAGMVVAMAMTAGTPRAESALDNVSGHWFTPDKASIIKIEDCGDGTPCGKVVWIDTDGDHLRRDRHNADPGLKDTPLEGRVLLHGFEANGERWTNGAIYNPENGHTYRALLERLDAQRLEVKGCVGPICRGLIWTAADRALLGE
ncbi:hypothetical protein PB2503_02037 [Parvularcula bermudensis HTCC2503]|uniref:DUF2147 domain-containing protein n=1 Tax=Parvularcula bermudensis (strain ATCC BAA-594 / HTCC2503 / KCTC 12087) TaxID=314260 RepID=E0TBZ3_PARBH|nr:DUF2147 domain-containing protein [Parvularcula bermudensis]ADM08486.1 hypothetical protein PB2503_02037 [Parvularcula bermudensis HTCC2503]